MMHRDESPGRDWKCDVRWMALLFALVVPIRGWMVFNTEVTARDSIGYIRYALQFEKENWSDVIAKQHQHPAYPLTIWAVSQPVRAWTGTTDATTMQLSAQLAGTLFALVLLIPMYLLGKALMDRRVGFVASLLFQYLPTSNQILSDAISEPLFLSMVCFSLFFAIRAFQWQSIWRFAVAGIFCGLAYLTRPEGALLLPVIGAMFLWIRWVPAWNMSWRRWLQGAVAFVVCATVIGSTYVYASGGRITNKLSPLEILRKLHDVDPLKNFFPSAKSNREDEFRPLAKSLFAVSFAKPAGTSDGLRLSGQALFWEVVKGLSYFGSVLACLALLWNFSQLRHNVGFWTMQVYGGIQSIILMALGMVVYYVSERHVMIIVLGGCYLVAAGVFDLPQRLAMLGRSLLRRHSTLTSDVSSVWGWLLLAVLIGVGVPKAGQPLHAHRAGNREAGIWLQENLQPGDIVIDDHGWSHLYSGLFFQEDVDTVLPPDATPRAFVVVTRSRDLETVTDRQKQEEALKSQASIARHWPPNEAVENAKVLVFVTARDPKTHPWKTVN